MRRSGKSSTAARPVGYRRSSFLISFWKDGRLIIQNYASGTRLRASPRLVALLSVLSDWRTAKSVAETLGRSDFHQISRTLDELAELSLLHRSDRDIPQREQALAGWASWTPEATFFHLATKNVPFVPPSRSEGVLRKKGKRQPPPPPLKRVTGTERVALPLIDSTDPVIETLRQRRTWRRFAREPVTVDHLSVLLGLTWGVQRWLVVPGQGKLALKTSPSPGARHNLEAYVLARRVKGLRAGLYHYDPDGHALTRIGAGPAKISTYVPHQRWYDRAAVLVVMTGVFERAQWRYAYPAVYRSILIEAGHFGQTFCLLATSLGLAPFSSGALADARIERDLKIDGVRESVIYACGAGTRPAGVDWGPWPEGYQTPRTLPPASARRRGRRA